MYADGKATVSQARTTCGRFGRSDPCVNSAGQAGSGREGREGGSWSKRPKKVSPRGETTEIEEKPLEGLASGLRKQEGVEAKNREEGEERLGLKEGQTKQGWKRSMKGNKPGEELTGGNGWQDGE